jgi:hypothetical protein
VQEGVFLDRAASQLALRLGAAVAIAVLSGWCGRCDVRDLLGVGVLAADLGDADVTSFAGFGECVVAAVEVLALLRGVVSLESSKNAKGD